MSLNKNHPDFMKFNKMFVDLWNLFKLYYSPMKGTPAEEEEWWEAFIKDCDTFCKNYDNEPFARALVMCLSDEMERKYKNKEKA